MSEAESDDEPTSNGDSFEFIDKTLIKKFINGATSFLVESKRKHKGRLPRGEIVSVVKSLNKRGISKSANSLSQRVKRWKGSSTATNNNNEVDLLPTTVTILNNNSSIASTITNDGLSIQAEVDPSRGGRPRGTTHVKKRDDREKLKECLNSITKDYASKKTSNESGRHGYLKTLIEEQKPNLISPLMSPSRIILSAQE